MQITPITLQGNIVRLEPLQQAHAADLYAAGDTTIWRYMPDSPGSSPEAMASWIDTAHQAREKGIELPFAIILLQTGQAIGSTRYLDISQQHRGLEIGWTWLSPKVQRTGVNTECKYLLLRHAFEGLGAIRVQLKTDSRNEQSQRAIERIGASREGVLRNHKIMPDGYLRHSVYYSIIESEWPSVKERLQGMMQRYNVNA
ncbi:GNAT family N-acetyltransferase [Ktedonospora formicarum]|uniref:N-acetyltransferase n=1 Tax=Ktedonospora formicarum TaxID=2778364 RepID=A0A8J3I0T1_9CHLR|nr:GNAT family protein [Ktedonospora formicarum]GHO42804.1 N-acetyltransferase [Ktedonospora formicarum]